MIRAQYEDFGVRRRGPYNLDDASQVSSASEIFEEPEPMFLIPRYILVSFVTKNPFHLVTINEEKPGAAAASCLEREKKKKKLFNLTAVEQGTKVLPKYH